jgi:hypothetical protein
MEDVPMPGDDDFKRLEAEFLALARRIFDAGAKAERDRIVAALQTPGAVLYSGATDRLVRERVAAGYGAVSAPVRDALIELAAESPTGVGAKEITQHFVRRGSGPDERQIRAALKTLTLTGNAVRAARGKYLPRGASISSPMREENSGDDAPEPFDLAAE